MAEYIVKFDTTQYDQMVDDGIIKPSDNPTLKGMPVCGEIIRCRDCKHRFKDEHSRCLFCKRWMNEWEDVLVRPNGFCAWAERDTNE